MAGSPIVQVQDVEMRRLLEGLVKAVNNNNSLSSSEQNNLNNGISDLSRLLSRNFDRERRDREASSKNDRAVQQALKGLSRDQRDYYRSDKRDRATQAALLGNIEKNSSAFDKISSSIKEIASSIKNVIIKDLEKSLSYYSEMSKMMRLQRLTSSQKNVIGLAASKDIQTMFDRFGTNVSHGDMKQFYEELIASGKDLELMGDSARQAFVALRSHGIDEAQAYQLAMTKSADEVKSLITNGLTDPKVRAVMTKTINSFDAVGLKMIDLTKTVAGAQSLQGNLSNAGLEEGAELLKNRSLLEAGLIEQADATKLLVSGALNSSLENIGEAIKNQAKNATDGTLRAMHTIDAGIANDLARTKDIIDARSDAVKAATKMGVPNADKYDVGAVLNTADENKKAQEEYSPDGLIQLWSDKLVSWVDVSTGGMLTSMSNTLDKYFGDSVQLQDVVPNGFKIVADLLSDIKLKLTLMSLSKLFSGGLLGKLFSGGGLLGKLTSGGLLGKLTSGIGGKLATLLPKVLPVLKTGGAVGLALGSIALAVHNISDTVGKYDNVDDAKEALMANKKNIDFYKQALKAAQDKGDKELEAKYAGLLKQAEESVPELQKKLSEAEFSALSSSEQAYFKLSENNQRIRSANIKEMNELQRLGLTDTERYKELKKQNEEMFEKENIVKEESTSAISYLFRLSADQMVAWHNFKKSISDWFSSVSKAIYNGLSRAAKSVVSFFTETIPNFFTVTVPDAISSAGKWIWDKISSFGESAYRLFDEYIIKPISNIFSWLKESIFTPIINSFREIGAFINKSIINPLINLKNSVGEFINDKFVEPMKEFFEFEWLPVPIKKFLGIGNENKNQSGSILDGISEIAENVGEAVGNWFKNFKFFSDGGIVNKTTPSIIGEAGKEAVLPLTKKSQLASVLNNLSSSDKLNLLRILIGSKGGINADNLLNIVNEMMYSANQSGKGKSLGPSALSNKIIEGAAAQYGKKYSEMVCNQMVEAALKYAGFTPPTTGFVTKHFHHPKMKIVLNDPIKGISPTDKALVPGMIMFSHPFTQAEATDLNRKKGGKRLPGDPGHMGIYAGDGLWWNSTSSKNTVDYSSGKGMKVTDYNKGFGVALTKPFTTGKYKLYAAGYYEGMFDDAVTNSLPSLSPSIANIAARTNDQFTGPGVDDVRDSLKEKLSSASTDLSDASASTEASFSQSASLNKLVELAMSAISYGYDASSRQAVMDYAKQASTLLNDSNSKEILSALLLIAKNTSKMASSSKSQIPLVSKVQNASFM